MHWLPDAVNVWRKDGYDPVVNVPVKSQVAPVGAIPAGHESMRPHGIPAMAVHVAVLETYETVLSGPGGPCAPAGPMGPTAPWAPCGPASPCGPGGPVNPVLPGVPGTPGGPAGHCLHPIMFCASAVWTKHNNMRLVTGVLAITNAVWRADWIAVFILVLI
jgi:hypothetical protein